MVEIIVSSVENRMAEVICVCMLFVEIETEWQADIVDRGGRIVADPSLARRVERHVSGIQPRGPAVKYFKHGARCDAAASVIGESVDCERNF